MKLKYFLIGFWVLVPLMALAGLTIWPNVIIGTILTIWLFMRKEDQ